MTSPRLPGSGDGPTASSDVAAARRLERLQSVTDAALAHLTLDDLLDALLTRTRDVVAADTAAILLLDESREQLVARAAKGLEEEVERGVTIPVGKGFAGRVAAEARPVVIDDVDHADILNPLLREKGVRSLLGVPLVTHGRVLGVLHVGTLVPRNFSGDDVELLQAAADRAALAIEHAAAYEAERTARLRIERLEAITAAALAHLEVEELLDELLTRIRDLLDADTAAILMLDESRDQLVARAAKGLEEEVEQGFRIPVGAGFAGRVAAERRPIVIDDVDHADILNPLLREKGLRSLAGVPLVAGGSVRGVLHVGTLVPRRFTEDDVSLLQAAADRAALALENARLFHAEREARLAAERRAPAAAALEYVGDGVVLLDEARLIRFWNPAAAAITGVAAEVALGRPVAEVFSGWESVKSAIPVASAPALTRAETIPIELEGREVWLSMSGVKFSGGTVYAFRDVTEQRTLEEWQTEFVATISHELRTPAASVYGAAQTLRREDVQLREEMRRELLAVIFDEADRLARLVDDVLVASSIDAGRLELVPAAFDAAQLVTEVVDAVRHHARDRASLEVTVPRWAPAVAADPQKVRHVLRNLVDNAVKYSPSGGSIQIRLEPQERHMRFAVSDEGLGIPPHERANIFEKFYRVRAHARLGISGTGLGLYICRELIHRMHGRIWVTSDEERGSIFYFELPLAVRAEAEAA